MNQFRFMYHCTTTLDTIVVSYSDRPTQKLKYLKNVALEGSALLRTCSLSFTTNSHSSTHIIKDRAYLWILVQSWRLRALLSLASVRGQAPRRTWVYQREGGWESKGWGRHPHHSCSIGKETSRRSPGRWPDRRQIEWSRACWSRSLAPVGHHPYSLMWRWTVCWCHTGSARGWAGGRSWVGSL